jgi:hypothetical protein
LAAVDGRGEARLWAMSAASAAAGRHDAARRVLAVVREAAAS